MTSFKSQTTFASKQNANGSQELFLQVITTCGHFNYVSAGFDFDANQNPAEPIAITLYVSKDPFFPGSESDTPVIHKFSIGIFDQDIDTPAINLTVEEIPFENESVRSLFDTEDNKDGKKSEKKKKTTVGNAEAEPKPKPNFIDA